VSNSKSYKLTLSTNFHWTLLFVLFPKKNHKMQFISKLPLAISQVKIHQHSFITLHQFITLFVIIICFKTNRTNSLVNIYEQYYYKTRNLCFSFSCYHLTLVGASTFFMSIWNNNIFYLYFSKELDNFITMFYAPKTIVMEHTIYLFFSKMEECYL
jgi:hypothetical protein